MTFDNLDKILKRLGQLGMGGGLLYVQYKLTALKLISPNSLEMLVSVGLTGFMAYLYNQNNKQSEKGKSDEQKS